MNQPGTQLALRDIHLPEPVSWWPPAPAWWLLAGLLLAGIGFIAWRRRQRRPLTFAHAELQRLVRQWQQDKDAHRFASDVSVLLRRVCLTRFPATDVAGLTGTAWLEFLARQSRDGVATGFRRGAGHCLAVAPYNPEAAVDPAALAALCRDFLRGLPTRAQGV